jgi:hypothetical protein
VRARLRATLSKVIKLAESDAGTHRTPKALCTKHPFIQSHQLIAGYLPKMSNNFAFSLSRFLRYHPNIFESDEHPNGKLP